MVLLDVLLRGLDGAVEQAAVADGLALGDPFLDELEQAVVAGEEAQQVILEGEEKTGGAGVALACAPSAQLAVDTAGLVPLGAHDVQAADGFHALAKLDVGAASGHVGCDGH